MSSPDPLLGDPPPHPAGARLELETSEGGYALERKRSLPERLRLAASSGVSNVRAAADCLCDCHPKIANHSLHEGGLTCPCQLSPAQRKEAARAATEALLGVLADPELEAVQEAEHKEAVEAGNKAGWAELRIGGYAPFQISGHLDGRCVYVRERHGNYRIELRYPCQLECVDGNCDAEATVIAAGPDYELYGEGPGHMLRALGYATEVVRDQLLRENCSHLAAKQWCPDCGLKVRQ